MSEPVSTKPGAGPTISIAVVDAETPGNIGTIARAMKNFGLSDLRLVDPPNLDPDGEAYGFAGRARADVLPNATETTFDALVENFYTVGCTALPNEDPANHVRYPAVTPDELPEHFGDVDTDIAIVFGRERVGLTNEELAHLDAICSIPASEEYPSLNLGQAATIICYELRAITLETTQHPDTLHQRAEEAEIERLYDWFDTYIEAIGHPDEKRPKVGRLFRRLVGRAHPTPRETRTLQGLFRRGAQIAELTDWKNSTDETESED